MLGRKLPQPPPTAPPPQKKEKNKNTPFFISRTAPGQRLYWRYRTFMREMAQEKLLLFPGTGPSSITGLNIILVTINALDIQVCVDLVEQTAIMERAFRLFACGRPLKKIRERLGCLGEFLLVLNGWARSWQLWELSPLVPSLLIKDFCFGLQGCEHIPLDCTLSRTWVPYSYPLSPAILHSDFFSHQMLCIFWTHSKPQCSVPC